MNYALLLLLSMANHFGPWGVRGGPSPVNQTMPPDFRDFKVVIFLFAWLRLLHALLFYSGAQYKVVVRRLDADTSESSSKSRSSSKAKAGGKGGGGRTAAASRCFAPRCAALCCIALRCAALRGVARRCAALRCVSRCAASHRVAPHSLHRPAGGATGKHLDGC